MYDDNFISPIPVWTDKTTVVGHRPRRLRQLLMLPCEECGRELDTEFGWRAEIVAADEEKMPGLAIYCPACWEREFGVGQTIQRSNP